MCFVLRLLGQSVVDGRPHLEAVQDEAGGDGVPEIQVPLVQVIACVVAVCKLAS